MNKKTHKIISRLIFPLISLILLTSIMVVIGWILDIEFLKSIFPGWVSMKFTTASSFFLCSMLLFGAWRSNGKPDNPYFILLFFATTLLALINVNIVVSIFTGVNSGIENLFVPQTAVSAFSYVPGRPSVMTLLNFILMVMIGFHFLTDIQKLSPRKIFFVKAACGFTVTVACLGILGHILEMPFLYYDVKSLSSGMAFHTCILFILQGLAALLILNPKHAQK